MGWAEGQAPPVLLPTSPVAGISGYFRETIRQDIRQAKERFSGQQLRQELARLQRRLDSVELLSPDIIMNLLLSYRDVQVCSYRSSGYSIWCQTNPRSAPGSAAQIVCESQLVVGVIMSLSPRAVVRLGHTVGSPCKVWCLHYLPGLREVRRGWWGIRWGIRGGRGP